MFLKTVSNPYENGLPTRSVMYRPNEMQTFAIDAEQLHKNPKLMNVFGKRRSLFIRALDLTAYGVALAGIAASFFLTWWIFLPSLVASAAMLLTNRKLVGDMAKRAAAKSNEHFLYLHSQRALWLIPQPASKKPGSSKKPARKAA